MSEKKEDYFCSAMRMAFIITLIGVILFLVIQYLYITEDPNSIAKFSAFFSVISSFGIFIAAVAFSYQKNKDERSRSNINGIVKDTLSHCLLMVENEITNINKLHEEPDGEPYNLITIVKIDESIFSLDIFRDGNIHIGTRQIKLIDCEKKINSVLAYRHLIDKDLSMQIELVDNIIKDFNKTVTNVIIKTIENDKLADFIRFGSLKRFHDTDSKNISSAIEAIKSNL